MKAMVFSMELDDNYEGREIAVVTFEYPITGYKVVGTTEVLMHKDEAEKYKLGMEVDLLE